MKKILLALALFFGLASVGVAAEKEGKKYNVKDLVDARVCIKDMKIDADVCSFSESIVLHIRTFRLARDYENKHEEAKEAGNEDEANKLLARSDNLVVEAAQHMLKACTIWEETSHKSQQFILYSVVYTNPAGEDKPIWDSQEQRILECEWAEDTSGAYG